MLKFRGHLDGPKICDMHLGAKITLELVVAPKAAKAARLTQSNLI